MSEPVYLPSLAPEASEPRRRSDALTEDQDDTYTRILEHFAAPSFKLGDVEDSSLTDDEKFWITKECLLRYLKATKWSLPSAIERLESTLKWRREFGLVSGHINADYVEPEAVTGKQIIFGHDVVGRPALYLLPSRQNTDGPVRQIEFTVWMLERCVDLMPAGVENLALLINFADKAKNPSLGTARKVLNILQSHYPERLGRALIINVPMLVTMFLNLIMPFVDPVTCEKIKFNPRVVEEGMMLKDQVTKDWGGSVTFEYDHAKYWKELIRLSSSNREIWFKRWHALGGRVGLSEWDIKAE